MIELRGPGVEVEQAIVVLTVQEGSFSHPHTHNLFFIQRHFKVPVQEFNHCYVEVCVCGDLAGFFLASNTQQRINFHRPHISK